MRKSVVFIFILFGSFNTLVSQSFEAYQVYNSSGERVDFNQVVSASSESDVVLFGELHNSPICHWLQLELAKSLILKEKPVALGAEMFETDDQVVINEYLNGFITLSHLQKEAKVWPNFKTDYLPLLELAKASQLPFVATNVPRRYASLMSKRGMTGLDSLSKESRQFMPSLPFKVTEGDLGYAKMGEMMGMHMQGGMTNFIAAQALKDYTMAFNINKNLQKKGTFIHFNGSFHSDLHAGIFNYLKSMNKGIEITTISAVEIEDVSEFQEEWKELGDFILVVSSSMTKTH